MYILWRTIKKNRQKTSKEEATLSAFSPEEIIYDKLSFETKQFHLF